MFILRAILTFAGVFYHNRLKKIFSFLKENWKLFLALALVLGLAGYLYFTISNYQKEINSWKDKYTNLQKSVDKSSKQAASNKADNEKTIYVSRIIYKDREAKQQIVYVTQKEKNDAYAQTPAGATFCRDAERVRQIDQLDADLFTSPSP